jgi:tetratricopeptide (TPR) repeat protein/TolB-like protein
LPPELVADPDRKRRFIQEAQSAAALDHPHIAMIFEIDEAEGVTFIAMELIRGEKLKDVLEKDRLPLARSLELATEVAEGLARAHDKGIVHRDLKPANIMVTEEGHAKIIDFGLAKLLQPLGTEGSEVETALREETKSGQVLGTVSYMSPEQASGADVDHRTDIFSLGIVLYEMLTGRHPFPGPIGVDVLHGILREPAPRLPDCGAEVSSQASSNLQLLMDKCLAKDRAERYPGMKDLVTDLRALREAIGTGAQPAAVWMRGRRSPWLWAAALGVAIATILFGWFFFGWERPPPGIGASGRPAIVVMYFEDLSGDETIHWLSKGVPSMLLTDLAQIPGLDVVSSQRLHEILKRLGQDNIEIIDKSLVSEIARRSGAGAVVMGSIFKSGEELRIDVQVEDVTSGRVLTAHSARGSDVFPLVDELTGRIRSGLQLIDTPADRSIAEVTTPSLEAYRLYSDGIEARRNSRWGEARELFEEAVKADPSFAMAYFELSYVYQRLGDIRRAEELYRTVLQHLDRLPERQKLLVEARYSRLEGKLEQSVELFEAVAARYPDEEDAYRGLAEGYEQLKQQDKIVASYERAIQALPHAGHVHNRYGYTLMLAERYPEAFREFETYVLLNPEEPNPYDSLGEAYLVTGQPEKAIEEYTHALEIDPSWSRDGRTWAFAMLGRYDEALNEMAEITEVRSDGNFLDVAPLIDPFILSRLGRHRQAEKHLQNSIDRSVRLENVEMQVNFELLSALLAIERENYRLALERTSRAEKLVPQMHEPLARAIYAQVTHLLAGTAETRSGDLEAARAHIDSQETLYDSHSRIENWFYQALSGEIALAIGDLAAAESHFSTGEPETKMFFRLTQGAISLFANSLPFRDGLARVKKAQGDLPGAIEIYRNLNTPGMSNKWTAMLEPRYVLEVARLLDELGDKNGARAEYQRFLELWKYADPELPELEEAKTYLAQ